MACVLWAKLYAQCPSAEWQEFFFFKPVLMVGYVQGLEQEQSINGGVALSRSHWRLWQ